MTARARLLMLARLGLGLAALGAVLGPLSAPAPADFGPIQLQSVNALEQAESAGETAISGNGEYLVFHGTLGGVEGIFRKGLHSGAVELVAGGSTYTNEAGAPTDAFAPSISTNGRYVSFTSTAALVAGARAGSNVYVRDMTVDPVGRGPCTQAQEGEGKCPYELASALNGSTEGITGGSVASGRVALSANGREVVFVTQGPSDLVSGNPNELTTPGLQVVVRYLESHKTTLVSVERDASTGLMTERPVAAGAVTGGSLTPTGAALSGDGSTVAWLGAHIPAQAPTLNDERQQIERDDGAQGHHYDEPLWRRIADGATAPTRRMVGGGDPLAPGCPPGGTLEVPACRGPYPSLDSELRGDEESDLGWLGIQGYDGVPQLSADGWIAALIGDPDSSSNVFTVDMHEGLDRVQALRQLTREVPVSGVTNPGFSPQYVAIAGDVYELAISPDGSRIAFTTQRQQFPLAPPNFTETPLAQLGLVELYQINLVNESLVRVTHGPDDGPSLNGGSAFVTNSGAASPSYAADDLTLSFADTASNLVSGDANGASDAFTVSDREAPDLPGPVEIEPAPTGQEPVHAQWRLSVVPVVRADGSLILDVVAPGAGELSAAASAEVTLSVGASRRGAGTSKQKKRSSSGGAHLKLRTVASGRMRVAIPGLLQLPLHVAAPYVSLLSTKAGIYATVRVAFKGGGGPGLSQTLTVSLRRVEKKKKVSKAPARAGGAGRGVRAENKGRR